MIDESGQSAGFDVGAVMPTRQATKFMRANDRSKVVEGWASGKPGEGGSYRLANGKSFRLTGDDCRSLPESYPIWDI